MNRTSMPLLALLLLTSAASAESVPVKPVKEWSGSVADVKLKPNAAAVITSGKELEALWKRWKIADKMPKVDFDKEFVVVVTGDGSELRLAMTLDDRGDLRVLARAT